MQGHPDGSQDASILAVEDLGPLQSDAGQMNLAALDALAVVRRGAQADECRVRQRLGADAEKLAVLALACPEPDAQRSDVLVVPAAARPLSAVLLRAEPALGKPDGDPSGARSCAVPELAGERAPEQRVFGTVLLQQEPDSEWLAGRNSLESKGCGLLEARKPEEPQQSVKQASAVLEQLLAEAHLRPARR